MFKRILIFVIFFVFIIFGNLFSYTRPNVDIQYFERYLYNLGRIESINKKNNLNFDGIFSNKNTICLVLSYHRFYEGDERRGGYYTNIKNFEEHLKILKEYGFEEIKILDLYYFIKFNKKIPERSFILTFDDGYKNLHLAIPILKKYGFHGVISVITGFTGSYWEISDDEIKNLYNEGFEFASHTHKIHNEFDKLIKEKKYDIIEKDLVESKKHLENLLNTKIISFTYPKGFGSNDKKFREILKRNGFLIAFDSWRRRVNKFKDDPYSIVRIDINEKFGYADPKKFKKMIENIIK
jgi:peptidoglycan/xylan/chitin deacetylase (PgdA/CDA1 family)